MQHRANVLAEIRPRSVLIPLKWLSTDSKLVPRRSIPVLLCGLLLVAQYYCDNVLSCYCLLKNLRSKKIIFKHNHPKVHFLTTLNFSYDLRIYPWLFHRPSWRLTSMTRMHQSLFTSCSPHCPWFMRPAVTHITATRTWVTRQWLQFWRERPSSCF